MLTEIPFTKASGAGNVFVVIDNRSRFLPNDKAALARALCSLHFGVGADGLLLVEPSNRAAFSMRYYNADGSYGGMCGNGGRCIARYAFLKGIAQARMQFESLDYVYGAEVIGESVTLQMKDPHSIRSGMKVRLKDGEVEGTFIDTGSPHFVVITDSIESFDLLPFGRELRNHPRFMPDGTNVNIVRIINPTTLSIRTYERGVEAETLACGTGSVASALVAAGNLNTDRPINVKVRSGEELSVKYRKTGDTFSNVSLLGSANMLFTGKLVYDDHVAAIVG